MMKKSGYIAIIGHPNVGKSTLLNHLLGQKLSITSRKPQTTRHQIMGIHTEENVQFIYIDTPGLHQKTPRLMNRYLNKAAESILSDVDVIVWLVEAELNSDDQFILDKLKKLKTPVILAVNKVDRIKEKRALLPIIKSYAKLLSFKAIVPISAKQGTHLPQLNKAISECLPEQEFIFPEDELTDKSMRFLAAELIREKLMRFLGKELPYSSAVVIEAFEENEKLIKIAATIFVERDSQKAIVIGIGGEKLKEIGTLSRLDIEKLSGKKVFLQLWVKVKESWADDENALKSFGVAS